MKKILRYLTIAALITAVVLPSTPVYAQDGFDQEGTYPINTNDVKAMRDGFAWWDPFWDACSPVSTPVGDGPTKLVGGGNVEKSYNYFVAKGLTSFQSAGIIGNLRQESGSNINPASDQPGGPGRGIAQWSEGGRWDSLVAWAQAQKRDPLHLDTQLDFIWHELNNVPRWKDALAPLKASKTVEEAVRVFLELYEVAGDPRIENRYNYARQALAEFGGNTPGEAKNTENTEEGSVCGGSGVLVDGYSFPVAPRTKRGGQGYSNLPCVGRQIVNYRDRTGKTSSIPKCHHDGTPAYDLMYTGVAGVPVYAITDGIIEGVNEAFVNDADEEWGKACASLGIRADTPQDKNSYWYGHILNPTVTPGQRVKVGDQIAVVATQEYGPICWGGGPHLHIDRGCGGQGAGYLDCRDATFLGDLKKIYDGLPES